MNARQRRAVRRLRARNWCEAHPYYGVQPHECFWRHGGQIGQSRPSRIVQGFLADPEDAAHRDPAVSGQSDSLVCGVYHCVCRKCWPKLSAEWDRWAERMRAEGATDERMKAWGWAGTASDVQP